MTSQFFSFVPVFLGLCLATGCGLAQEPVFKEKITSPEGFEWVGVQTKTDPGEMLFAKHEASSETNPPAQTLSEAEGPDPRPFTPPRHYICMQTDRPLVIDGRLDEPAWAKALWSEPFADIRGYLSTRVPMYTTRMKLLWDDKYLYIAAQLDEPHVWATLKERNSVIFHDNDFEVFIDPDADNHHYFEFEMNAFNTVWNLFLDKPYKNGGTPKIREMAGQKTAVHIQGTLNNPADRDVCWQVELAFPFAAMKDYAGRACPPNDGDQWRMNFSRVQWGIKIVEGQYHRIPPHGDPAAMGKEDNWIWSPQGVVNMHRPETWGYVQFSSLPAGEEVEFMPDPTEWARYELHRVLYAQTWYHLNFGGYADSLELLGLDSTPPMFADKPVQIEVNPDAFKASVQLHLPDMSWRTLTIDQDAKIVLSEKSMRGVKP
ncbi:MAG: carbohydrate-binding family 9-like protein [Sedimentisphaerales bacterium]|nr:carbohydrate-binding family 9-like protein [Sedimentisphaerales bacterium]